MSSDSQSAESLVDSCDKALNGVLHHAVVYSSALEVFRIRGPGARELLAMGSGVDLRPASFVSGDCCRTRFAQIPVIIVALGDDEFELYCDRTFTAYVSDWLADSIDTMDKLP